MIFVPLVLFRGHSPEKQGSLLQPTPHKYAVDVLAAVDAQSFKHHENEPLTSALFLYRNHLQLDCVQPDFQLCGRFTSGCRAQVSRLAAQVRDL